MLHRACLRARSSHATRSFSSHGVRAPTRSWTPRLVTVTVTALTVSFMAYSDYDHEICTKWSAFRNKDIRPVDNKERLAEEFSAAARGGKIRAMERYLNKYPSPNGVNDWRHPYGWTPLQCAAANGQTAAVQWLLDHGADVNAVDECNDKSSHRKEFHNWTISNRGWSALHHAVWYDHIDVVCALLNAGADTTQLVAKDNSGCPWYLQYKQGQLRKNFAYLFQQHAMKQEGAQQKKERLARIAQSPDCQQQKTDINTA